MKLVHCIELQLQILLELLDQVLCMAALSASQSSMHHFVTSERLRIKGIRGLKKMLDPDLDRMTIECFRA
jgi:hypothetical protein